MVILLPLSKSETTAAFKPKTFSGVRWTYLVKAMGAGAEKESGSYHPVGTPSYFLHITEGDL